MQFMPKRKTVKIEVPIVLPSWNRVLAINHWGKKKFRDLTDRIVKDVVEGREANDLLLKEYIYLCRPSQKNKNAVASARKRSR